MTNKINITTKTGDRGTSRLYSGEEISKSHLRLETYGEIDELVSLLGIAKCHVGKDRIKDEILQLQKDLFVVASELSTTADKLDTLAVRVDKVFLDRLELRREALNGDTAIPEDFIIPGSTLPSSYLDLARCVARRVERKIVKLVESKEIDNLTMIVWFNRISDYLYLMARFEEESPALLKDN